MTVPRLIVFDLDGTLIDSVQDLATAANAALARFSPATPPLPLERIRAFIGNGAGALVQRALAAAGLDVPKAEVLPVFLDCYNRCLLDTTVLYPGVADALDRLSNRTLAVLTNKPGAMSRRILSALGVAERFFRIYGGDDVPAKKPDPAGLRRLMEESGAAAAETVLVGDSAADVRAGRAAGVRTVGVSYGLDPESLKSDPPDLLIDDLRDLAGLAESNSVAF